MFGRLVSNLAIRAPLAIFIDDLQWGDLDSARLLQTLFVGLSTAAPTPLLLVLAYRGEKDAPANSGLEILQEGDAITHIVLGPLPPEQGLGLAATLLGKQYGYQDAADIAAEAGGSPFFLRQLAEHKKLGGSAVLGQVIQDRTASLPPLERRLLEVLAIARAPVGLAVLRDAAELGEHVRLVRSGLDSDCLIRSLASPDEAVAPYHDRIAEAIGELISPERRREIHGRMALALEKSGNGDTERIALHFYRAGAIPDACRLGRIAAERSAAALAFERAAALFGQVLEWSAERSDPVFSQAEVASLEQARGDALVNCGHGVRAARAFQRAVPLVPEAEATALRVRVASELLRAGEIREGLASLRGVLSQYRLPFPGSRLGAIVLFLRERLRLSCRLLLLRVLGHRGGRQLSAYDRTRLDVCWAAATGTGMVYPLLTEIYCAMYLRLALRCADAGQLAIAWGSYASRLAYFDDGQVLPARTTMARAEQYAEADGSPYVLAFMGAVWATIEGLNGNWRRCQEHATRAEFLFRTRCVGVAWELATVSSYLFTSRTMLGEWKVSAAEMPVFLEQARSRGDRYAEVTISLVSASYAQFLMDDQPDAAEADILERLASWPRGDAFDVQQLYAFQSLVNLDLYRANPRTAWNRIASIWPAVERSGLLRITLIQTFLEDARARAALALAPLAGEAERRRLIGVAKRASRLLFRCKARYAPGLAHLLAAGVALFEGDTSRATVHLLEAESSFERSETIPWLAITQVALASCPEAPGREHKLEAGMAWMNSQQIRRPECLVRMLFPSASFLRR
jgi:tetratricopeptide (TPR) repeat protein